MADPFDVRSGTDPGTVLLSVDPAGNLVLRTGAALKYPDVQLDRLGPGQLEIAGALQLTLPAGTPGATHALDVITAGDANSAVFIRGSGEIRWSNRTGVSDTNIYRNAAAQLATDSSFLIRTAGAGLQVAEGSNARMGTAVLVAGAVTVANTSVTANTRIYLTSQVDGGAPGFLRVSARTPGTSFTITSGSGTDTSTVAYLMVEPSA